MNFILFSNDTGETKMMSKFRSLEILDILSKGNLSVDIRASRFGSENDAYGDIVYSLEEIFDLVNS